MTNNQTKDIQNIVRNLLDFSERLRYLHNEDTEYSPTRNNIPNSIVFIERAADELKEITKEEFLKAV